jgi:hypothetical protein
VRCEEKRRREGEKERERWREGAMERRSDGEKERKYKIFLLNLHFI